MTPLDRKYALALKNITQKEIAIKLGVSPMQVTKEINDCPTSERVRRAIAEAIGRDRHEVFPSYYFSKRQRRSFRTV